MLPKGKAGESYFSICYIQSRVIRLPSESKALKIKVNPIKNILSCHSPNLIVILDQIVGFFLGFKCTFGLCYVKSHVINLTGENFIII